MKCLAVNSATKTLSIAIIDSDKTLYAFETPEMRDQGNIMLGHIRQALAKNGLTFNDLDLLAVVTGPGSFTGIRVGLAAMRGLALASKKPLVGLTSFDMFACPTKGMVNLIAVESWREELYLTARDENSETVTAAMNTTPEEFIKHLPIGTPVIISGDAKDVLKNMLPQASLATTDGNAVNAAKLAVAIFRTTGAGERPVPYYMRAADVTVSTRPTKTVKDA